MARYSNILPTRCWPFLTKVTEMVEQWRWRPTMQNLYSHGQKRPKQLKRV